MDLFKLSTMIFLLVTSSIRGDLQQELKSERDCVYQDLRVNGEVLWKGCGPDCPSRYEALRPLLDRFKRPFTVLDLGANNGYFSIRIAEDYDATCVMIDGTERLRKICEYNTDLNNLIYLKKWMTPLDIEWLAKNEHFDVVLCFHVLHHVDWGRFVAALFQMGDYVIIETPPVNDVFVPLKPTIPAIAHYLLSLTTGTQIGSFVRGAPEIRDYMIQFYYPKDSKIIRSDFENSLQYSRDIGKWVRIPCGISEKTFKSLNGVFPPEEKFNGLIY